MERVVTYSAPNSYSTINLTPDQADRLTAARAWPRTATGVEYCQVSRGLHRGYPTFGEQEIERLIAGEHASDIMGE